MRLEPEAIHLWVANEAEFTLANLEGQCLKWLSVGDRQRYNRLVFDRHRKQLLLGRLLLRSVLTLYDDSVAMDDWAFTANEYGKPALDRHQHQQSLFFNVSHSQGRLVMAIARQDHVGVDIEWASRPRRVARIAARYFAPAEVDGLMALPVSQQLHRFYQLWTLKEAYIKARGLGLAIPLQQFSFDLDKPSTISVQFDPALQDNASLWGFWQIDYGVDWQLALAIKHVANVSPLEPAAMSVAIGEFNWLGKPASARVEPAVISRQTRP